MQWLTKLERRKQTEKQGFRRWWAWYPVKCTDIGRWVWCEWVWYKGVYEDGVNGYGHSITLLIHDYRKNNLSNFLSFATIHSSNKDEMEKGGDGKGEGG